MKNFFKKALKSRNGITLIALVITIIVLLILAGISISMLSGDNSILTRAVEAKEETRGGTVEEQVQLWELEKISYTNSGGKQPETMDEIVNRLVQDNLLTNNEKDEILGNEEKQIKGTGKVTIGSKTIVFGCPNLKDYIQEGDTIKYDATKLDAAGTKTIDTEKLKYKSPKGNAVNHGNGEKEQTFTAKSGLTWKVLSVSRDKVEIIPETVIKTDANENFTMKGAIAYLYAEQELNEICKLYGYGYGSDTNIETEYKIGGPLDADVKRKITGSGARSIIVEDINKLANLKTESDFKALNSRYGTLQPTEDTCYVTITSETGISSVGFKNDIYTGYKYDSAQIDDFNKIKSTLFNGNYWLSSRLIAGSNAYCTDFGIRYVMNNVVRGPKIVACERLTNANEVTISECGVRPVVTIKGETIDVDNSTTDSENGTNIWNLK